MYGQQYLAILLCLLLGTLGLSAQSGPEIPEHRTCAAADIFHGQLQSNPAMQHHRQVKEQQMQQWLANNPNHSASRATYTFPVVVHVVYNSASQNIPDALIHAQIDQLNADFGATNTDIGQVPSEFPTANADIEFKLATVDPNGNPTTGITRTQTSVPSFSTNDGVKFSSSGGVNAWDTNTYFNIWVCNIGGGILGYAQFPSSYSQGGQNTDGLVLNYFTVGSLTTPNPQGSNFRHGRTATHEFGHCLGLRHIWGDDNGSCSGSDFVNDTPNSAGPYSGCPSYPSSSCSSNDMTMNFMDYPNDQCLHAFTPGQVSRMVAAINNFQHLQNKINAAASVTGIPQLVADFSSSSSVGCSPLEVDFTDQSSGATSWSWSFPGGTPSSFNGQTPPTITYNSPGNYTVTLSVSDGSASDSQDFQITVNNCDNLQCNSVSNLNNGSLVAIPSEGNSENGYISGHNNFGDLAIAEHFTNLPAGAQLNGVEFRFAGVVGDADLEFVIWEDDNGSPGIELHTHMEPLSNIAADVSANVFSNVGMGGLLNLPSSCFIGFKMNYNNGTQVVLATNNDGETTPGTAWSQLSDGSWLPFSDANNWDMNLALAVRPNVCVPQAAAPEAAFSSLVSSTGCETAQVEYSDASLNSPASWSWSFPGGTPSSSSEQNPVVNYFNPGTYQATLQVSNSLGTDTHTENMVVVIPPLYSVEASASPTIVDLADGATVNFVDNSPGALFWNWDLGDGNESAAQSFSHTYTAAGVYTVVLEVSDGFCLETRTFSITVEDSNGVNVNNISGVESFSLFPNPATDMLQLKVETETPLDLNFEVFNLVGERMMSKRQLSVQGVSQSPLDISGLAPGTYFIRLTDGKGVATAKFLKL